MVGINTAINYGAENIGFAVPVNTAAARSCRSSATRARCARGYLGVEISNLDCDSGRRRSASPTDGALVAKVDDGQPGAKAGVEHGDVIVAVDGRAVKNTRDLIDYVSASGPAQASASSVLRDGKRMQKTVKLGERPGPTQARDGRDRQGGRHRLARHRTTRT